MTAGQKKAVPDDPPSAEHPHTNQEKERKTEFLTARQLARLLQVSEATIHRLRRSGRIPAVKLTEKLIRFNLRDVSRALRPKDGRHPRDIQPDDPEGEPDDGLQLSFVDLNSDFQE